MLEATIGLLLVGALGLMVTTTLDKTARWASTSEAKDALSDDIMATWNILNEDLSQSCWYIPDTTQSFATPTLSNDRSLLYAPYIIQTTFGAAGTGGGLATHPLLRIFNRNNAGDMRLDQLVSPLGSGLNLDDVLPGKATDRGLDPSSASFDSSYQRSYFARSQDLIFVRMTTSLWNHQADRPIDVSGRSPSQLPEPIERFTGSLNAWLTPDNHAAIGVLFPSGYFPSSTTAGTWVERTPGVPYGRVMDSAVLDTSSGSILLQSQLEQNDQPVFQTVTAADVRYLGYQVVPSPGQRGLGRLVRTFAARNPAVPPAPGSNPGEYIARLGSDYLVVDRVISDNVVRAIFETARHTDQIGVNNVRATLFFAKVSEKDNASGLVVHRAVTMIFCLHGSNTVSDRETTRSLIKTSATPAAGAIPFSY